MVSLFKFTDPIFDMADSRKRDTGDDHYNRGDQPNDGDDLSYDSRSNGFEGENESTTIESRVTDPLTDETGGDFFVGEDRVLRWLQALDMQVMGACRGDERLKPLLKMNVSNGMAEDRLLAHLSQV